MAGAYRQDATATVIFKIRSTAHHAFQARPLASTGSLPRSSFPGRRISETIDIFTHAERARAASSMPRASCTTGRASRAGDDAPRAGRVFAYRARALRASATFSALEDLPKRSARYSFRLFARRLPMRLLDLLRPTACRGRRRTGHGRQPGKML